MPGAEKRISGSEKTGTQVRMRDGTGPCRRLTPRADWSLPHHRGTCLMGSEVPGSPGYLHGGVDCVGLWGIRQTL